MLEEHHHKIGYSGIIVQNDECHLGKRKYNRGHKVDGVWVWGGIEQNNEKKLLFLIEKDYSYRSYSAACYRRLNYSN